MREQTSESQPNWGFESHPYALMEKNEKFQWRWLPPYPMDSKDGAYSPLFSSLGAAKLWHDCKHPNRDSLTIDGWKVIPLNP